MRNKFLLVACFALVACATEAAPPVASPATLQSARAQLIVLIREPSLDPKSPQGLERLSAAAGTPLTFLRSTAGGESIFAVTLADQAALNKIVARLNASPLVVRAEIDALVAPNR